MKTLVRLLLLSGALTVGAQAAPFLAVSDDAELFLTGTLGVRQDSNIFLTGNATSDTIFDISPGVQYVFGNKSPTKGAFRIADNITAYASHSGLNSNLLTTSLNSNYDDGKTKASFNASYVELNQNTVDLNLANQVVDALIRRNIFDAGVGAEVRATQKSTIGIGFQYDNIDYRRTGFSSSQKIDVPVNYYYEVTPKLDASFGYHYTSTWQDLYVNSADHFVNVGLRGEITPKLSGEVHVGVTKRRYFGKLASTVSNTSLLGVDSNFVYAATPKASLQFGVQNAFQADARGNPEKNFAVNLGGNFNVSEQLSVTSSIGYRAIHYFETTRQGQRTDHYWEGQLGVTYRFNAAIGVTAAVAYRKNTSDIPNNGQPNTFRNDFNDNVWSLAANFRY